MIAARPRRSALYMPAANARAIEKARDLPCDVVFLDLEDAVAPAVKQESRQRIVEALLDPAGFAAPTGIVGVLASACADAGFNVTSLWASVPHYVSDPPNPKATLALLSRLEEFLGESIERGDLLDAAAVWEERVDELVADDDDIMAYVRELESRYDTAEATGEEIAQQFERYLRRRER